MFQRKYPYTCPTKKEIRGLLLEKCEILNNTISIIFGHHKASRNIIYVDTDENLRQILDKHIRDFNINKNDIKKVLFDGHIIRNLYINANSTESSRSWVKFILEPMQTSSKVHNDDQIETQIIIQPNLLSFLELILKLFPHLKQPTNARSQLNTSFTIEMVDFSTSSKIIIINIKI